MWPLSLERFQLDVVQEERDRLVLKFNGQRQTIFIRSMDDGPFGADERPISNVNVDLWFA
ncbi:MAG: hypothetical protein CMJ81_17780 [Planctomycetaceae bacterium]|nr:hypothetical protein [Planctomycetaceae bacterium]